MSPGLTAVLLVATLVAAYAVVHRPLGDYMARVYQSDRHLKVERLIYRALRIDPDADQRWTGYAASVLAFSWCLYCSCTPCSGCRAGCPCRWG